MRWGRLWVPALLVQRAFTALQAPSLLLINASLVTTAAAGLPETINFPALLGLTQMFKILRFQPSALLVLLATTVLRAQQFLGPARQGRTPTQEPTQPLNAKAVQEETSVLLRVLAKPLADYGTTQKAIGPSAGCVLQALTAALLPLTMHLPTSSVLLGSGVRRELV